MDTVFDRDTAVTALGDGPVRGDVASGWRAGRGPHGGYLAAMLLRALIAAVDDPVRTPRSLTIHYARAPEPGPVEIRTTFERQGRSLSTLSARMEQGGTRHRAGARRLLGAVARRLAPTNCRCPSWPRRMRSGAPRRSCSRARPSSPATW